MQEFPRPPKRRRPSESLGHLCPQMRIGSVPGELRALSERCREHDARGPLIRACPVEAKPSAGQVCDVEPGSKGPAIQRHARVIDKKTVCHTP
jgi:hypothetical protein